jgi:hypothetical protein
MKEIRHGYEKFAKNSWGPFAREQIMLLPQATMAKYQVGTCKQNVGFAKHP